MPPVVRAFLVDDSAVSRLALRQALATDPRIEIVGEANSGEAALERIPGASPDIVLMDIVMPGFDGFETTRELMHGYARPIIVISDMGSNAATGFEALRAGALDVIGKPNADELADPAWVRRFCHRIRMLAEIPVITRHRTEGSQPLVIEKSAIRPAGNRIEMVCIGASTGGPPALKAILDAIKSPPRWPVLIVQHMSKGFTNGMASWLGNATNHDVRMASDGERGQAGVFYIAPNGGHLELGPHRLAVTSGPPLGGHRPAVDRLFSSAARSRLASRTVAVLLTGMGSDGARGLEELRKAGAWTIAQDEASSVVYGMPKAAVDLDAACEVLPLTGIARYLGSIS